MYKRQAVELFRYAAANARSEADSIAIQLADSPVGSGSRVSPAALAEANRVLRNHELTLQGGFVLVYRDGHAVLSLHVPRIPSGKTEIKSLQPADASADENPDQSPAIVETTLQGPVEQNILKAAQRNDDPFYTIAGTDYTLATSGLKHGGVVVAGLPIPPGITATSLRLRKSADAYWTLFRERRQVRWLYTLYLLLITALALFACCWLALNLSKQVTRPMESLADAMEAIADGDYAHRVPESATDELGELAASFNAMAADLESAHSVAERSTNQLSEVNAALQQRRTELETIIETIPNGVVTLSPALHIVLANRAFCEMVDPGGQKQFVGLNLADVLPAEIVDSLNRLLRRAHRMGSASAEMQMPSSAGMLHLSATIALLEGAGADREPIGYVLVIEDATELSLIHI